MRPMATLDRLCADLGPALIEVAEAPRGLDVLVLDATVHDPAEPLTGAVGDGDLVLAVGAALDDRATAALLHAAGAAGAVAVVCKRRGRPRPELLAAASASGVALLSTDPDVTWGQLYDLVRAALAADPLDQLPDLTDGGPSDLFELADATAALAGGPITIEDTRSRVLAFSHDGQDVDHARVATILGRRVPDQLLQTLHRAKALEQLSRTDEPTTIAIDGALPRRAIAVRAGKTLLGSIWLVCDDDAPLPPAADAALRAAAQIAAMQLLRRRVTGDLERRLRSSRLQALLTGEAAADHVLEQLELSPAGVAVAAIETTGPEPDGAAAYERLVDLLVVHLRAYRRQAEATVLDGRLYLLASCRPGSDRDALRRSLGDGMTRAGHTLRTTVHAGLSAAVSGARALAEARRSADQALELGGRDGRVVGFEEVHARAIVADVRRFLAERATEPSPELQTLIEHDRETGSDFVETLRASLAVRGDNRETARLLQIHINTVRYRLRRIVALTGVELQDSATRFALELQLHTLPLDDLVAGRGARTAAAPGSQPARTVD